MIQGERDPVLEALRAKVPPGAADFLDYCREALWPATERCAKKAGFSPMEQRELAIRVVRAAVQQFSAAYKRVHMRDVARRPQ